MHINLNLKKNSRDYFSFVEKFCALQKKIMLHIEYLALSGWEPQQRQRMVPLPSHIRSPAQLLRASPNTTLSSCTKSSSALMIKYHHI